MDRVDSNENTYGVGKFLGAVGFLLWLAFASATLIESDAYRYSMLLLNLVGLYVYLFKANYIRMNTMVWICLVWGIYALVRFVLTYAETVDHERGASEWLYVFPLFFPLLGITLTYYHYLIERLFAAYFCLALGFLVFTTDYIALLRGDPIIPLIQNNRIHGAVACGIILVTAFYWFMHYAMRGLSSSRYARLAAIVAPLTICLCILDIYGSKSKGVWLAVALVLPVMFLLASGYMKKRAAQMLGVMVIMILGLCIILFAHNLYATAGPTMDASMTIFDRIYSGGGVETTVIDAIGAEEAPKSMSERMQLWINAWQVFMTAPVFGAGNGWLAIWKTTKYASIGYTLMHNGYLEIMIRHGVFGLIVFFTIMVMFLRTARRAFTFGIISAPVLHGYYANIVFFCLTLLSNSNNRLAIGEMFFLAVACFAFFCKAQLELQERKRTGQPLIVAAPWLASIFPRYRQPLTL